MKLHEIYTPSFVALPTKTPDNHKEIGSGSFSSVTLHPDAHQVSKNSTRKTALEDDAYFQYIHRVVDDRLYEGNPYFPRIYHIEVYGGKNEDVYYKVDMEKLTEIYSLSEPELQGMYDHMFEPYENNDSPPDMRTQIIVQLRDLLSGRTIYSKEAKDPLLSKALDVLKEIHDSNKLFAWDIYPTNVMARRTPVGCQLVLTDLLYNHKELD